MLEPFAASVLTSLLHVRPHILPSPAPQSALRTMPRALSADFFTPHPRRAKGKERACADEACAACGSEVGAGEAMLGASASSLGSARPAGLRSGIPNRPRARRLSNQRPLGESPRGRVSTIHSWHTRSGVAQRRHASTQPRLSSAPQTRILSGDMAQHHSTLARILDVDSPTPPDEAWKSYEYLYSARVLDTLPNRQLLSVADTFLSHSGTYGSSETSRSTRQVWAARVQKLLLELEPRIEPEEDSNQRRWLQSLLSRVAALRGDIDAALEMSRRATAGHITLTHQRRVVAMYRTLVFALHEFRGPEEVLNVVLHDWDTMRTYLDSRSVIVSHQRTERPTIPGVEQLRSRTFQFIAEIRSPVRLLVAAEKTRSSQWRLRAGELLIDVLSARQLPHDALAVLREIYRQNLHVPGYQQLKLVQALAKAGSFEIANPMFANLRKALRQSPTQLGPVIAETGLYLFAMQGDVQHTQAHFRQVRDKGGDLHKAVALLLHVHAVKGDSTAAVAVFNQYCTADPNKRTLHQITPNIVHYSSVIHAHARRGDREGMNLWLQKLADAGHTPDKYVYNVIMQAFAERSEVASMGSVLDQMRAAGIPPNAVTYTIALTALADRRDPVAAEALFREATKDGIVPDLAMLNSLMDAHVRAGSWRGVINVFDYMIKQSRERSVPMSIATYNTLLKGFVSIGAPFTTVFRLFHRLEELQLRPDPYTFALVTQSACDGNVMDVAEKMYSAVKQMSKKWENGMSLTVYIATIVMGGYLKMGNRKRARQMYREMIELGIQPSSVTFSNIIKAYGKEGGDTNVEIAKEFIHELMVVDPENQNQDWMQNARGAGSALEEIYGPLLWAYTKATKPGEVETLLQELFSKGGEPSLLNMTALLEVYRRTDNVAGVREVWPQIYKMALELSDLGGLFQDTGALPAEDPTRPGTRRQATILAMPLSIYIDVLSAQGSHAEVSRVWQELRHAGFNFDSHNWNHLIIALVRAGEIPRAFEVIERVLIPFRRALANMGVKRDRDEPSSPLITDYELDIDELSRPPILWPTGAERRAARQREVRRGRILVDTVEEKPEDFAHALHILRQISPQYDQWRPHSAVLHTLADVVEHLQRGHLVQPVGPAGASARPPQTLQDIQERAQKAQEILDQVYEESPNALEYAHRWIDWRKSRGEQMKRRERSGQ